MHKQAWQTEIEAAIKARDFASAQRGVDEVLIRNPGNKEAHILQEEILVRRTQDDEKNPIIIQGTLAQFAAFAFGLMMFGQPFATICFVMVNTVFFHHTGPAAPFGLGRLGGELGPLSHVSPWTVIFGSLLDLCLGAWLMKTAFESWKNS